MTNVTARGGLCICTGIAPEHEADFNRWYDKEHMQERAAIPGFLVGRRFKRLDSAERPYLALYETSGLDIFHSAAYRQAFGQQTEWSLRNFRNMRDSQRRVGTLLPLGGAGEGSVIAVVPLSGGVSPGVLAGLVAPLLAGDGLMSARCLETDAGLSTPLGSDGTPIAPPSSLLLIEGSDAGATERAAVSLARELGGGEVATFGLLWRL